MMNVFLSQDVMTSELNDVIGGGKVKVKVTTSDGTTYEVEYEF